MSFGSRVTSLGAAQVAGVLLSFAGSVVLTRSLTPASRGAVVVANMFIQTAIVLLGLGLPWSFVYLAGKESGTRSVLVWMSLLFAAAIGLSCMLVALPLRPALMQSLLRGVNEAQFYLALVTVPMAAGSLFIGNLLLGSGFVREFAVLQVMSSAVSLVTLAAALILLRLGPTGAVASVCVSAAVVLLVSVAVAVRRVGFSRRGAFPTAVRMVSVGLRSYGGFLSNALWLRADAFLVNMFGGNLAVGYYSLATSMAEKLWLLESPITQAVLPDIIASDPTEATSLSCRASRSILLGTSVSAVILAGAAPWVIPLIYGEAYRSAVTPLALLLPGVVLLAASRVLSNHIAGQLGRVGLTSLVSTAVMLLAVVLYAALIPPLGANGAALASTLAYGCLWLVTVGLFSRLAGVSAKSLFVPTRSDLTAVATLLGFAIKKVISRGKGAAL